MARKKASSSSPKIGKSGNSSAPALGMTTVAVSVARNGVKTLKAGKGQYSNKGATIKKSAGASSAVAPLVGGSIGKQGGPVTLKSSKSPRKTNYQY